MKKLILASILFLFTVVAQAQILNPVKWSYAAKKTSNTEAIVFLKATIQPGWYVYSQNVADGGPVPTSFTFKTDKTYSLVGKTIEPASKKKFDNTFSMNINYFENSVVFQQKIKLVKGQAIVKGTLEYMVCNNKQCLPPTEVDFSITVK